MLHVLVRFSIAVALAVILPLSTAAAPQRWKLTDLPMGLLPDAIASFGAAASDGWLYVYGGHIGETHQHSRNNVLPSFRRMRLDDFRTWEELAESTALQSPSLVAYDGKIYRIGGLSARNAQGEPEDLYSVDEAARFDPELGRWEAIPSLPEPRSSHDAVVLDGKIYVLGGWTLTGSAGTWLPSAYVLDLSAVSPKWERIPDPPVRRRALAAAAGDGKVFLIGGFDPDTGTSKEVYYFDTATRRWSRAADLPFDGFGAAAAFIDDRLIAGTGTIHELAPDEDGWHQVTSLVYSRIFHRFVPMDDGFLAVLGGASRAGHLNNIEVVAIDERRAQPRVSTLRVDYPGSAKNRQGIFLKDGNLIVFGGNNSLGQHDFEPHNFLNEAYRLSLASFKAERLDDFPVARQTIQTVVASSAGYAVGGFGHDGDDAVSHADVFRYTFGTGGWTKLPARLPRPLTQFGLVERAGQLWVFGGLDFDPARGDSGMFQHSTDVLVWDKASADSFTIANTRLPRPRRAFGGALLDGRYYLVGGMGEQFQTVDSCDVFDFESAQWTTIPPPARPRISAELVSLNGKLYLAGGSSPSSDGGLARNASVEVFDPASGRWSIVVDELLVALSHVRMMAFEDSLLLYAPHHESGGATLVFIHPGSESR